jgi:hypothetical protein
VVVAERSASVITHSRSGSSRRSHAERIRRQRGTENSFSRFLVLGIAAFVADVPDPVEEGTRTSPGMKMVQKFSILRSG